jgi:hypothetical protein
MNTGPSLPTCPPRLFTKAFFFNQITTIYIAIQLIKPPARGLKHSENYSAGWCRSPEGIL